jgi:formate hydrogenlyase subunit 5
MNSKSDCAVSSSFFDRLEEVGIVAHRNATAYGLLGPIARASGLVRDLRKAQPYLGYEAFEFDVPRVNRKATAMRGCEFCSPKRSNRFASWNKPFAGIAKRQCPRTSSVARRRALGWVEAPRGGTFHWVRLDESGRIARYRVVTPSFANWHSFHLAVEKFAFQDFPIMLSTFDLSVAENDR